MKKALFLFPALMGLMEFKAQEDSTNQVIDSLYILDYEEEEPEKVLHAEPLYIDLIRDLGARKGEKEWNLGFGLTDKLNHDSYEMLVEYEFAPMDRLGLEIEAPFTLYTRSGNTQNDVPIPSDRMESLKLAAQWSFYVSEKYSTSLALGYINEIVLSDFNHFGKPLISGNIYNPFFVAAKRWGNNFHTLIYTGPHIEQEYGSGEMHFSYEINTNFHYMVTGTRNFIGVELNKSLQHEDFDMTIRPQMRLSIADNFLVGIVTGIPINRENQRFSMFLRLIWEPGHH